MNDSVKELLRQAEAISGSPVQVIYDANLPISARLQFARRGASHHLLVVQPGLSADYFIANQVGILKRLFALPASDRFDFVIAPKAQQATAALVDELLIIAGALDTFSREGDERTRQIASEIAILGMSGLDINDPDQKYTLRTLPGSYSGLHLVAMMYTGFKLIDPTVNAGIDFAKEYDAALAMRGG